MFSNRRNALASGAMLASIALSGARAQSAEDESRLLIAVTAPKVVAVGGDSSGDGYATISFKTGPNLQSYDYTVSCYQRDLDVPTTSCKAISEDEIPAAGNSVSGETGKAYNKIIANVTGLDGADTYDCFIYTYGPLGYDKCKYIGSTDIDCFEAEPVTLSEESTGLVVDPAGNAGGPSYSLGLGYEVSNLGSPAIGSGALDAIGFACVEGTGGAITCPSDTIGSSVLAVDYPAYPDTLDDVIYFGSVAIEGAEPSYTVGTQTGAAPGDAVVPNTAYTCYSLIVDTCDQDAEPICSEPIELVSPPTLATAATSSDLFTQPITPDGTVTVNCDRDASGDGDAEVVTNWWTCTVGISDPVWYPVTCDGADSASHPIPNYVSGTDVFCALWQGQGPVDSGCSPYFEEGCTWFAVGASTGDYASWYGTLTYGT